MKPSRLFPASALAFVAAAQIAAAQKPSSPLLADPAKKDDIKLQDDQGLEKMKEDIKLEPNLPAPPAAPAPGTVEAPPVEEKPKELPEALKKLRPEQLQKYGILRDEATTYMRSVRLQEALEKLAEADREVGEPVSEIENLRGAVYTKMRDFGKAREAFNKALELDKESFHPRFNIAELDFVEKKWESALKSFLELIKLNDSMKAQQAAKLDGDVKERVERQFASTTRLMQFKILICQLQQKMEAEAKATLKEFQPYDDDSPAYYFGNAAAAFAKEDKETAEEWINSAKSIYRSDVNEIYIDSLVEMGWLQTLQ